MTKRSKPTKTKAKKWLTDHGHQSKVDKAGNYLDLIAEYQGLNVAMLRRLLK